MKTLFWGLAAVLALAAPARAGPLERNQVAANARWVVHVDGDAFRSAGHARKIADRWLSRDPAKKRLAWLREQIGLDPMQDLHSITFYGASVELGRGVVIVRTTVDRERLLAYLKKQPGYKTASHGSHRLHLFQIPEEQQQHSAAACLHGPAVIVFGRDVDQLTAALDVLDGKAPRLAADSPLARDVPPGTILWLGATGLAEAEMPLKSPFVRLSKQLLLALGEHDRKVFLEATLLMKSEEHAGQMRQVIEGLRDLAKQQPDGDEDVKRLLQTLEVSAAGQTVNVRWRAPAHDVVNLLEGSRKPPPDRADRRRRQEEHKKKFLEKYDKNRNGKIDDDEKEAIRAEWTKATNERRAEYHKRLLEKYDTNKDGKLDDKEKDAFRAEWSRRMEEMGKRKRDR